MVETKDRLISLDVFRGLTMACMILVENPGNWTIYHPLRHARWGMVYGVNCISVYFVSHIVASTLYIIKAGEGEDALSLHQWINLHWFQSWLSPANASLAWALLAVAFWLVPLWVMYRKRIFIKV